MADQLRLLNGELELIEPWLVVGKRLPSAELVGGQVTATAWQLGQSRLVYVPQQEATSASPLTALDVEGVPETAKPHLLSPAGLLLLRGNRVAGGYRVHVGSLAAGGFVLLTDDARSLAATQQRLGRAASTAAKIERGLAVAEVSQFESIRSQLLDTRDTVQASRLAALKRGVQQVDQLLAARDYPRVLQLARQVRHDAGNELLRIERASRGTGFTSVPTQYEPRLLPTHQALEQSLRGLPRGPNVLPGGDFEDLQSTKSGGWLHANYAEAELNTAVTFTSEGSYHGGSCLRLTAQAATRANYDSESDPKPVVWITSPRIELPAGTVIEINGWARVTALPGGASGRLLVLDNLGGEQLALRIPSTTGWQPFQLIRTVDDGGSVQLNLALTGAAIADIDAVMIREVERPQRTAAKANP